MRFILVVLLFLGGFNAFGQGCDLPKSKYENESLDSLYGWDSLYVDDVFVAQLAEHTLYLDSMLCILRASNKTRMRVKCMPDTLQNNYAVICFTVLEDGTVPVFKLLEIAERGVKVTVPVVEEQEFVSSKKENQKLATKLKLNGVPLYSTLPEEYEDYINIGDPSVNEPIKLSMYWEDPFEPVGDAYTLSTSNYSDYIGKGKCFEEADRKEMLRFLGKMKSAVAVEDYDGWVNYRDSLEFLLETQKVKVQFFVHSSGRVDYVTFKNLSTQSDRSECVKNLTQSAVNIFLNNYVFLPAYVKGYPVDSYFEFTFRLGTTSPEKTSKTRRKPLK